MTMIRRCAARGALLLLASLIVTGAAQARGYHYHKEHHLGPTGIFGVTSPTNIIITKVEEGSPAHGKVKKDDVIVGVGGVSFSGDARREMADAIDEAETTSGGGILSLTLKSGRWARLELKVLGSYSKTAPYDCEKTDAIITQTAEYLMRTRKFGYAGINIGLLGLLATGEKKYVDFVGEMIRANEKLLNPQIEGPLKTGEGGFVGWSWGYSNLLLCEYYLMTGDRTVLPAIRTYSLGIARGQDASGLWNHRLATLDANFGKRHGRLFGYAVVNQTCLPLLISMTLAEKCGIREREVTGAIRKTRGYYSNYIGKGALPYGVHGPFDHLFSNNGTSASAAVAFAVGGDRRGASFFSRLSAASHTDIEKGHTGHFFSQLWSPMGANVAGPEVTKRFFGKTRFIHTLNRKWDGNFTFDGCGYPNGIFSYRGLSDAGSHLISYCVGRRKLHITGKDADRSLWLEPNDALEAVQVSELDMKPKADQELIALTGHSLPQIRRRASSELRSREGECVEDLRLMMKIGNREQREGACRAAMSLGEDSLELIDDLAALAFDRWEDPWVREKAVTAICGMGRTRAADKDANGEGASAYALAEPALKYLPNLLQVIVDDDFNDPFRDLDRTIGMNLRNLCEDPYAIGLVEKHKKLYYEAVNSLLDHTHHWGRTAAMQMIWNMPLEDLHLVADKMVYVIKDTDRTYMAYHGDGQRSMGLKILDRLNIEDAIELTISTIIEKTGRIGARVYKRNGRLAQLMKFGANAKPVLERLKKMELNQNNVAPVVKAIEESKTLRKMITLEEAIRIGRRD